MFDCKMSVVEDAKIWERVKKMYYDTLDRGHSSSSMKPIRVFAVTIPHMVSAFETDGRKVGNIKELWHGTRVFNCLSILKRGFVLPTQLSTAQLRGDVRQRGVLFRPVNKKFELCHKLLVWRTKSN